MGASPEANAARMKALPLFVQDQDRFHDAFMSGPDCAPADEAAKRRFFGED